MKLTLETAKALQPGGRIKDHNPATKGLELRARGTVKSWHLYYVINGTERRPKLGEFPAISVDEARKITSEWKKQIARGVDPSAERQALRGAPTVADLIGHYLDAYGAENYKPSTLANARSLMELYILPNLGALRVAAVTTADVNGLLERIASGRVQILDRSRGVKRLCDASPTNANRVRAYLSKAFSIAEGEALRWRPRGSNPCKDHDVKKWHEAKRRTHIASDEFRAIFKALEELSAANPWHVACIFCALFAGSRITEMATLPRAALEVDTLTGAVYARLADHKTFKKTGEHRLYLPRPAVEIVRRLPVHKNGFLFGDLAELKSPRRSVWEVWNTARERAGIRGELQARDLRRTFASVAKSQGASLEAIGDLLRHESSATTERYAFLFADKAQELAESTAETMAALMRRED